MFVYMKVIVSSYLVHVFLYGYCMSVYFPLAHDYGGVGTPSLCTL